MLTGNTGMSVTPFCESQKERVLSLSHETFGSMNLSRFEWQPCRQAESLEKQCTKFVFADEHINGYVAAYPLDHTHFRLNLIVDPNHLRKGIGSQLLKTIEEEVIREQGKYLQARVFETMPASLRFALDKGFTQIHTMRGMSLHAADFSFEKWREWGKKLSAGFVFTSLKEELEADVNAIDKLARLYKLARDGWPSPDPTWHLDSSQEDLRAPFVGIKYPEHFSIVKADNEFVGFTSARNPGTGTAVHPDYRNLGLATYLKALDLNRCIKYGQEYFESASANPAMQQVNEKLGYRLNGLAEVRFVKALS